MAEQGVHFSIEQIYNILKCQSALFVLLILIILAWKTI